MYNCKVITRPMDFLLFRFLNTLLYYCLTFIFLSQITLVYPLQLWSNGKTELQLLPAGFGLPRVLKKTTQMRCF